MDETPDIHKTRITLLEKIRNQHDDTAWSDFVKYYRTYIYNIIHRMGMSHHDSEEVVQIVLLKSWNKLPSFQYDPKKGRFRGWLCRVAGNAVRNYIRDEKKRFIGFADIKKDVSENIIQDLLLSSDAEIDKIAEEEWEKYIPDLAWKNISGSFDITMHKTYALLKQGKSPSEIAQAVGLAESSVYVYRKRIQDRLKAEIARLERELN